jgi:hypothetical protein
MSWWAVVFFGVGTVSGFNRLLTAHWQIPVNWKRLLRPPAPLICGLAALWSGLPLNRRPHETRILANLGLANSITVFRGVLVSLLAWFWTWPAASVIRFPT